tara:strand:+ start:702 stop:1874 length:1173 start_codon:yes stop_codon:yes gene_type:complete
MYPITRGKKKVFRFDYYSADNKKKFLQAPSKKILQEKIDKKFKDKGFVKTNSEQVKVSEAQSEFIDIKLANKRAAGKTQQSTIDDYNSFFYNHIFPYFKNKDIRTITKFDVAKFVNELQEKVHKYDDDSGKIIEKKDISSQTLIKIFNHFKNIISYQVDRFKIENNVCKEINYLTDVHIPEKEKEIIDLDVWTLEVMQEVIGNIDNPMIKLIFMILLETAARPSEIRALERENLLFLKSNSLKIDIVKAVKKGKKLGKTKTKKGKRKVDISPSLKDHIVDYLNTLPPLQDKLFLNTVGKYICIEALNKALINALKKMRPEYQKLPIDRKSYAFRHYRATYFAAKGRFKNALELAHYIGDLDINFVNKTYIAPFEQEEIKGEFKENIIWKN